MYRCFDFVCLSLMLFLLTLFYFQISVIFSFIISVVSNNVFLTYIKSIKVAPVLTIVDQVTWCDLKGVWLTCNLWLTSALIILTDLQNSLFYNPLLFSLSLSLQVTGMTWKVIDVQLFVDLCPIYFDWFTNSLVYNSLSLSLSLSLSFSFISSTFWWYSSTFAIKNNKKERSSRHSTFIKWEIYWTTKI